MKHSGGRACHWCMELFERFLPGCDISLGLRRHLPLAHRYRDDPSFGDPETLPPPAHRSHAQLVRQAAKIDQLSGTAKKAAMKKLGIDGSTWLTKLFGFDLVADIMGDMMHGAKNAFTAKILPLAKGLRQLKCPKEPSCTYVKDKKVEKYTEEEMAVRMKKYKLTKERWQNEQRVCTLVSLLLVYY